MRQDSAAYKAPNAPFFVISNAKKATSSQRKTAKNHNFELILRDEFSSMLKKIAPKQHPPGGLKV